MAIQILQGVQLNLYFNRLHSVSNTKIVTLILQSGEYVKIYDVDIGPFRKFFWQLIALQGHPTRTNRSNKSWQGIEVRQRT